MDPGVLGAGAFVVLLELTLPILLGLWAKKKYQVGWKPFLSGAMFFVLVQVVHAPLVIYTQGMVAVYGLVALAIYLGLMAGLFEEVGRYLVFKKYFPKIEKKTALMFGIGWGGIEMMLVGLLLTTTLINYAYIDSIPLDGLSAEQLQAVAALKALRPVDFLPGLLERMMAITLHVAFTLIVYAAVTEKKPAYLGLAIGGHALVDFVAVYMIQYGVYAVEGILLVFALIGAAYIIKVLRGG